MFEKFKLTPEQIEKIEMMVNNSITIGGEFADMEIHVIDTHNWEATLYISIEYEERKGDK